VALVELEDGGVLNVEEHGAGYPLILLHGGPGLDHHELRPWLDPLGDAGLRLIYVDGRGQGASPRVDPAELSLSVFTRDVDRLARAIGLGDFALLGHSFGAIVALSHALEHGTATHYVLSAAAASSERVMEDVERAIERFEPASMRDQIRDSWSREATVTTVAEARETVEAQLPFHFMEMGDAYRRYTERDDTVYAPEVLAHFAGEGYGGFELLDHLRWVSRPVLLITGRHDRTCTVAGAEDIAAELSDARLVVLERAGHMAFVEQPKEYLATVRGWLIERGVLPDPSAPAESPV
jgi:proline iminopeptidase